VNRVGDHEIGTRLSQFLLFWNSSVSRGIVVQEQNFLPEFHVEFFSQHIRQLHKQG